MPSLLLLIAFILLVLASFCLRARRLEAEGAETRLPLPGKPLAPTTGPENSLAVPRGYCLHPGHTWALKESAQTARIGLDGLAAVLIGTIDKIEVARLHRWVRQGERVWTVTRQGLSVDMLSPVEGAIVAVNAHVLRDPSIVATDPYGEGWILEVRSPEMKFSLNHLMKGRSVRAWIKGSIDRLKEMTPERTTAAAPDAGPHLTGLLAQAEPGLQQRIVRELFLHPDETRS